MPLLTYRPWWYNPVQAAVSIPTLALLLVITPVVDVVKFILKKVYDF